MNRNRLTLNTPPPDKDLSVAKVWLLNLIPYSGAGYFYAVGSGGLKLMIFVWIFLLLAGPLHLVSMYVILSCLGTAAVLNKNSAKRMRDSWLDKPALHKTVDNSGQSPMLVSRSERAKNKAEKSLKRLRAASEEISEEKSHHAIESFEYKLLAAEKQLKARNEAEVAAPSSAPNTVLGSTDPASPHAPVPKSVIAPTSTAPSPAPAPTPSPTSASASAPAPDAPAPGPDPAPIILQGAADYIDQINTSLSAESAQNSGAPGSFSFSFDNPLAPKPADGTASVTCPSCSGARDMNFSFCLTCGYSFS